MNEYTRIQNTKDRAALLVQLVNADARAMQAAASMAANAAHNDTIDFHGAGLNYMDAREELWKLIGPAEEGEAKP